MGYLQSFYALSNHKSYFGQHLKDKNDCGLLAYIYLPVSQDLKKSNKVICIFKFKSLIIAFYLFYLVLLLLNELKVERLFLMPTESVNISTLYNIFHPIQPVTSYHLQAIPTSWSRPPSSVTTYGHLHLRWPFLKWWTHSLLPSLHLHRQLNQPSSPPDSFFSFP